MSDSVGTPRLEVFITNLSPEGDEELVPLVDSAADSVISFSYKAPGPILDVRFLDQDGFVGARLAGWSLDSYAKKHLDGNGYAIGPVPIEKDFRVAYRMDSGGRRSDLIYGTIIRYSRLEASEDSAVTEIRIAPSTSIASKENLTEGVSYKQGNVFETGTVEIGKQESWGQSYGSDLKRTILVTNLVRAMEDVLAYPITISNIYMMGVVVIPDELFNAIEVAHGTMDPTEFELMLEEDLGFSVTNKEGTLYLANTSRDVLDVFDDDPSFDGLAAPVKYVSMRLKHMLTHFGIPLRVAGMQLTGRTEVKMFRGDLKHIRSIGLVSVDPVITSFAMGDHESIGSRSDNSKTLKEVSQLIAKYRKQKIQPILTKKGLLRSINDRVFPLFKHGVADANVISIVGKQSNDAADYGLLTQSTQLLKRQGVLYNDTKTLDEVLQMYKKAALTNSSSIKDIAEALRSEGVDINTVPQEEAVTEAVKLAIDETLKRADRVYEGVDPRGVAAFLVFVRLKQMKGADIITVKTPLDLSLIDSDVLFIPSLLLSTNMTTTDSRRFLNNSILTGFYRIFKMRHVVMEGTAYTEFDMVKESQTSDEVSPEDITQTEAILSLEQSLSNYSFPDVSTPQTRREELTNMLLGEEEERVILNFPPVGPRPEPPPTKPPKPRRGEPGSGYRRDSRGRLIRVNR